MKKSYKLIVNPKIIEKGDEEGLINEGCLSFPGLFLKVLRPLNVVVEYVNTNGEKVNEKLEGMMSRVFQHETDHLNGITFDTLVSKLKLDMAMKKLNKRLKHNG